MALQGATTWALGLHAMPSRYQRNDHHTWLVFLLLYVLCGNSSAQDKISEPRPLSDFESTTTDKSGTETIDDDSTPKESPNAPPTVEYESTEKVFENKELNFPVDI